MTGGLDQSVVTLLEFAGIIAFAASGSLLAVRKDFDLIGVLALGTVTALGGGFVRDLVIAEDLTSSVDDALDPCASLAKALEVLDRHRVQSWPVVKERQLLGIVRRTDIYSLMRRR